MDFVINGPGDHCFPELIDALENNNPYELIKNLIYKSGDQIIKTIKEDLIEQDDLPDLPYDKLTNFIRWKNIWVKHIWAKKHWLIIQVSVVLLPVRFVRLFLLMKPGGRQNLPKSI